ncbi:minor tail protein [Rhodococcus phage WC1]|uniref:Minor tail protein n=1 Tax=Rhodococcus phage CosmicSans TaxID=1701851 RepID=A0A0K2CLZ0_9CAUD|nr:minor tail protein [Rhodococcus phage CosmicSans]ALA46225.1 minor tail protein [Rhodococcus phage Rhodalysa]ALN97066.1 minor tail protein [Rhodococcus phage TWAMP]ALO80620.1 minor tail protein [Rhodococcus phage Lillie]AOQ27471.1 minor tail protein [Rhodococcus phage Natosaleda]ASR84271.1 minor tail protein [Rhodococcus phage StCroix]ASR84335.1 minor tail protein [Rhodococcus phage Naiad]ASR84469.1 minor tail protein [Rhodococcus phage RexFury]ASR84533.1 minor tail protein [Rhodococcus p
METEVKLEGVNGKVVNLAGPLAGDQGIYLASGITGLYDPKVKVIYEEPANYPGARYLTHRILKRDVIFKVEILGDGIGSNSWKHRDSEWARMWDYAEPAKLTVTTEDGPRTLGLQLSENIDVDLTYDPIGQPVHAAVMSTVGYDPFWYSEPDSYKWNPTGADQTYRISVLDPNPTDQPIWPEWVATAPGKWTITDYSWQNDDLANRRIELPTLTIGEDVLVKTDPRQRQVTSANKTNVWARMGGVRFRHPIPKYTLGLHEFEVRFEGDPTGAELQLRLPRPWSRPWGLLA